jgi:large subunit ribosomal protein L10Ae
VDDLKKMNKNKKLVKKMAKKYDAFLVSNSLIRMIPRLLGPGLSRMSKFPAIINAGESLADKVADARHQVKFALKKVLCLSTAVANVTMAREDMQKNIVLSVNFLASLLKKNWQNVGAIYIKSSMGPSFQVYY